MKIISFGWTWPALFAEAPLRKTVTRRDWDADYAASFKAGELIQAYDKSPRFGGKRIALIKLGQAPYFEPVSDMPDDDYEAEGFAYLNANRHLLPKSMPYDVSKMGFNAWRKSGEHMWVVRFVFVNEEAGL